MYERVSQLSSRVHQKIDASSVKQMARVKPRGAPQWWWAYACKKWPRHTNEQLQTTYDKRKSTLDEDRDEAAMMLKQSSPSSSTSHNVPPPHWSTQVHTTPAGRKVSTYYSPLGQKRARSIVEAWRIASST